MAFKFGLWKKNWPLINFWVFLRSTELKSEWLSGPWFHHLSLCQNYSFFPLKQLFLQICQSGSVCFTRRLTKILYISLETVCITHFSIFCYIILDLFPVVGLPLTTIKEIIENFLSWSHWLFYRALISLFSFHHWRQNITIERLSE